jgi:hypothetical protein
VGTVETHCGLHQPSLHVSTVDRPGEENSSSLEFDSGECN